jgi:hypothetical protein
MWSSKTLTCDILRKQNFQMKSILICTINDFPAYSMVFGWSTNEKLACSYCMENNKAFMLTNGSKMSFFYCHRQFLPTDHKYRKNRKDFFVSRVQRDVALLLLSGEELYNVVSRYNDIIFGFQPG